MPALGRVLIPLGVAVAVVACTSPESTRTRAGGPGADPGNRRAVVQMHEGAQQYWHTPRRLADSLQAPTETARQADRSKRGAPEPAAAPSEPK
jgi:hypothetical protein